eukprot:3630589-Pleurochrysis_carterae.AAC.1
MLPADALASPLGPKIGGLKERTAERTYRYAVEPTFAGLYASHCSQERQVMRSCFSTPFSRRMATGSVAAVSRSSETCTSSSSTTAPSVLRVGSSHSRTPFVRIAFDPQPEQK